MDALIQMSQMDADKGKRSWPSQQMQSLALADVKQAVRQLLPGTENIHLGFHAMNQGAEAVAKWESALVSGAGASTAAAALYGFTSVSFPVEKMYNYLSAETAPHGFGVEPRAALFLAAVLDYLCGEIVELAGSLAEEAETRDEIRVSDVQGCVDDDVEMDAFFNKAREPQAGGGGGAPAAAKSVQQLAAVAKGRMQPTALESEDVASTALKSIGLLIKDRADGSEMYCRPRLSVHARHLPLTPARNGCPAFCKHD